MVGIVIGSTLLVLVVAIGAAVYRAKRRPNRDPRDVYPLW